MFSVFALWSAVFCHLTVDFGSSSVVPDGIKLIGLTDTYCNLAIQPGGWVGRVICDREKYPP